MEQKKLMVIKKTGLKEAEPIATPQDQLNDARKKISETIHLILSSLLSASAVYDISLYVGPNTTVFLIDVEQKDFGRLLGAKGKNIGSIRTLVASMSGNLGFRGIVQIKDEEKFLDHGKRSED